MGTRLNDNFQEALQFLTIGAGIILGARLSYLGVLTLLTPEKDDALQEVLEPFGHGYLLPDTHTWVQHSMDAGGRAALALALAIGIAVLMSMVAAAMAGLFRKALLPMAVAGGRSGLFLGALWGLFAAFALPPTTASMSKDGITLHTRPAVFGQLSLPLPATSRTIPWAADSKVSTRSMATFGTGCGSMEEVVLSTSGETFVLAQLRPEGRDCSEALHVARSHTAGLAMLLDSIAAR